VTERLQESDFPSNAPEDTHTPLSKIYNGNTSNWTTGIDVSSILLANGYSSETISAIRAYAGTTGYDVVVGNQAVYVLGSWGEMVPGRGMVTGCFRTTRSAAGPLGRFKAT
jgi:hypothetical protein